MRSIALVKYDVNYYKVQVGPIERRPTYSGQSVSHPFMSNGRS